jgi:hypothetical protein
VESREIILQELTTDSQLQIIGRVEDAELFSGESVLDTGFTSFGGAFPGLIGNGTTKNTIEVGEYFVVMRGDKLERDTVVREFLWCTLS